MHLTAWILLSVLALSGADHFLWFENEPDINDPCTLVVIGGERGDLACHHLPASCTDHGGFYNYANYGRVWLHLFIDIEKKQEFEVCLTGGGPESTYVWYDYARRHWEPMVYPQWHSATPPKDNCKKSINGTMDLFFEPIWYYVNYVAYVTWNITKIEDYQPKPWPPEKSLEKPFTEMDAEMFKPEHLKKRKETREKYKQAVKEAKEKDKQEQEKSKSKKKKKKKKKPPKPRWKR